MIIAETSVGIDGLYLGKELQKIATEESEMLIALTELVVHGNPWHELGLTQYGSVKPLSELPDGSPQAVCATPPGT